jgi:predicted O-linked N-acetylglucosamine transferase (SPINDLY family)/glycosyltransferase involved in cell wall biosynthesis
MRIVFVDPINWDYQIETPYRSPLGGSQSALCYLAEALATQGHDIFLLNSATLAGLSRGVVCLPLNALSANLMQSLAPDALVILNSVAFGRQIKPLLPLHTRLVCWLQSAHDQSNVLPLQQTDEQAIFDGFVLVSDWQRQQFQSHFKLEPTRVAVLRNAIAPAFQNIFPNHQPILAAKAQPPIVAYTSTPFRGLDLLLDAIPGIRQAFPGTVLKVFSSMQVYQQNEADDLFSQLYRRCRETEGVEYVGSLSQPALAQELRTVTALTYPNTFFETSCIAVLEAMACGCQVITSNLGALLETTAGFAQLISVPQHEPIPSRFAKFTEVSRQNYLQQFISATIEALSAMESTPAVDTCETKLRTQVDYVNQHCVWSVRAQEWVSWLASLEPQHSSQMTIPDAIPTQSADWMEEVTQLGQAGRFAEAIARCQTILQHEPENARAWDFLGLALFQSGKASDGLVCLQKAIALAPHTADIYSHLGVVYCKLDQWVEGIDCYRRALELHPQSIDIQYNLALALHKQGKAEEAMTHYQQLLVRQPNHVQARLNLGNLLQQHGQFQQAITHYQQALAVCPDHTETWQRLGSARQSRGELEEAVRCYQYALTLNPSYLDAHNNLGTVLQELGRAQQAIAHYQQALSLQPNFPYALLNLGNILLKLERFAEAEATYRQLLQQDPNNLKALDGLVKLLRQTCQWTDVDELSDRLITMAQRQLEQELPCAIMPLNTLLLPFSPAQQQAIAQEQAEAIARRTAESRRQLNFGAKSQHRLQNKRFTHGARLRLGYVSGDFRDHAVAHLILQLFRLHNRQQFEVFAYSLGPDDGSTYRARIEADCDRFVDIQTLTPTAMAQRVFDDEIDILIDLAGYTEYSCPDLFALHPAPIQINYLGYPGTLGATYIDYILTDAVLTPPEETAYFTETCVYLPHCYQINDNQQQPAPLIPSKISLGLPDRSFVYCCFNNTRKIDPHLFAVWMQILTQVPDSVLWLYQSYPDAERNLKQQAERLGVDSDRLVFAHHVSKPEHLARLQHADLFLDTRYYNAHTTASDALWAGIPLVTLYGETFAARVAASLLTAIGLPDLITYSLADYEQLAVHLGKHPDALQQLKQTLMTNQLSMPLYNTEASVQALETAYLDMAQTVLIRNPL